MQIFKRAGQSVPAYRQKLLTPTRADYTDTAEVLPGPIYPVG